MRSRIPFLMLLLLAMLSCVQPLVAQTEMEVPYFALTETDNEYLERVLKPVYNGMKGSEHREALEYLEAKLRETRAGVAAIFGEDEPTDIPPEPEVAGRMRELFEQQVHRQSGLLIVHGNRFFFRAPVYRAGALMSIEVGDAAGADVFLSLLELSGQAGARDLLNHVSVYLMLGLPDRASSLLDGIEVSPNLAARAVLLRILTDHAVDSNGRFR